MIEVHPIAALFPMLAADELTALADDISARGLLHPIVLDAEGRVLDGRNRLAACDLAGVEPTFTTYEGDDPDGYALAVNAQRRDLTQGKRALIAVKASGLYAVYNFGDKSELARTLRVPHTRVAEAALVDHWTPGNADAVLSGAMTLTDAVGIARAEKRKGEERDAKLARLRNDAPDLLALVEDGRMTADDATAVLDARLTKERQDEQELQRRRADERRDARALLARIVDLAAPKALSNGFVQTWADHLGEPDRELDELMKRADAAVSVLISLQDRIAEAKL